MIIECQTCQFRQSSAKPKALSIVGIGLCKRPHDISVLKAVIAAQCPNGLRKIQRHLLLTGNDSTKERHW